MADSVQLEFSFGRKPPTVERLKEVLDYDPGTGDFRWKVVTSNRIKVGMVAGRKREHCLVIGVDGKMWRAHQMAWLCMTGEWPPMAIDHINGNPFDNRWENLRLCTMSQNLANAKKRSDNKSGYKGVMWAGWVGKWQARIGKNGKYYHLGFYTDPAEAHKAYCRKAEELYGEFARSE